MKESNYIFENEIESLKLKDTVLKYFKYWKWFVISALIFLIIGYLYVRYTPVVYESVAKIKIVDDSKEMDIAADPLLALAKGSNINLDNEIEILKSYRLLNQVVEELNLDISYYEEGNISTKEIYPSPFEIVKLFPDDSLSTPAEFKVSFETNPPTLVDAQGIIYQLDSPVSVFNNVKLPIAFRILDLEAIKKSKSKNFSVRIKKKKKTSLNLLDHLDVTNANKNSEILTLRLRSESAELAEAILNTVVTKFNLDGIKDRQLVSKRTLEFIDERFEYLTEELDSIEGGKQEFKMENNLSYIETDAESSLLRKAETEDEVAKLETQISLASVLKKTVQRQSKYQLLPVNIGLENPSLTSNVSNYNQMALERDRMLETVGESHPTLVALSGQLERAKLNIVKTVNAYQSQLRTALYRLNELKDEASSIYSSLPEKEKRLRSIERQQSIKENLFLLLLQKREEAAVNLAVTAPSVKIVDYALTESKPILPKKSYTYLACLLLGLITPFSFLFIKFTLDTKVKGKHDLVKICQEIPIVGEIPNLKNIIAFTDINDRSIHSEYFRILSTNLNYILPKKKKEIGQVILVTSSMEGEGKTQIALNLSLSYASFNKKVLLVGADLRNPQLHSNFKVGKSVLGLSDYLSDSELILDDVIQNGFGTNRIHKICLGGAIPPNPSQLLSDDRFEEFLNKVKSQFDYIVIDTAPTILVADTLVISKEADVTLYVTKCNFTDKGLLEYAKELHLTKKLKNMAFVINDANLQNNTNYKYAKKG